MSVAPRVLQVLPALSQGGVERATLDMANALMRKFPKTPTYVGSAGGVYEKQLPKECMHICLPLNTKNPLIIIANAFRLAYVIKKYNIQIVHARSRAPAWSAWLACKITKTHFLTTYHAAYKGKTFFKRLYNSVMARGDAVITISEFITKHVEKNYPWANAILIREGIDTNYFDPEHIPSSIPTEKKTLFLPSRISPTKGIFTALQALSHLKHRGISAKLLLIRSGKESHLNEVDVFIKKNNLSSSVEFLEPTSDLRPYYKRADIVLVPSLVPEAFGRVAVEAMLLKKIVIGTNHGALRESIVDGKTGFLTTPGNHKDLAEKIQNVIKLSSQEHIKMAELAQIHALENFSLAKMTNEIISLYQKYI